MLTLLGGIVAFICGFIGYRIYRNIQLDKIMELRHQAGLDNTKEKQYE